MLCTFPGNANCFTGNLHVIIFIVLHGYLNPNDLELSLYGIVMVGVSAGIGYLLVVWGIYASITAHFIFDLIMFLYLKYAPEPPEEED